MSESTYDRWADIYDSVYSYVRSDIPFYVEEAVAAGGPVLELGCGTGRVTIPIAEAGVDIVGLDSSPAMLAVARSKIAGHLGRLGSLSLVQGDMRDFSMGQRFDLVIIPFRGFLALMTVEDQMRTLENIKRHLTPVGKLVFNVFVPDMDILVQEGDALQHFRDVTDPRTGAHLILWHQSSSDNFNQIISIRTIVEELDDEGVVGRRLYRDFQLRYVYRWEMHHLLQACGYRVLDLYGGFNRCPFDEFSTEMVWVSVER